MRRAWATGLASCTAMLVLVAAAPQAGAQDKARKARAAASAASAAAKARDGTAAKYAQRFAAECAACHGANGRSDMPLTPVLAGQPSLYAITQLFLFREARRGSDAMNAVAKNMSDDDLRGFSDHIGTLPPVPAPPPAAARIRRAWHGQGRALAQQHRCVACHGAALDGGQQVPRIAGQREDYLKMTLRGFQAGTRAGYTQAMTAAVSHVPVDDLDTLAYFVARFPGVTPP
ncbi:c-type cytochrome [Ramlibacter montanisoli]|uniref:C-type cytochrome n=1 Tax=Ramlibacter montanisoli TaxID=2732512 RepID=A0A849K9K3_9BURK|nr:c-type cytochrome [Ramlibacter montanisoli]NNU43114.1 c-type cytochrome [Ramlibacter montanisoli]